MLKKRVLNYSSSRKVVTRSTLRQVLFFHFCEIFFKFNDKHKGVFCQELILFMRIYKVPSFRLPRITIEAKFHLGIYFIFKISLETLFVSYMCKKTFEKMHYETVFDLDLFYLLYMVEGDRHSRQSSKNIWSLDYWCI